MSAQTKQEKKVMDEKIAKVREVVRNVSTNDIVLALHNFELDVERTIHAFCEGGSESALGSWETGGQAKKQKKNKPKSSAPVTTERPSKVVVVPQTAPSSNGYSNGYGSHGKPAASVPEKLSETTTFIPALTSSSSTSQTEGDKPTSNKQQSGPKKANAQVTSQTRTSDSPRGPEKYLEKGVSKANDDLFECFQSIRQKLAARERELADQMALSPNGARFVFDSSQVLHEIAMLGEVAHTRVGGNVTNSSILAPAVVNGLANHNSTSHSSLVSSLGEDSGLGQASNNSQTSPVQEKNVAQVDNGGFVMQSDAFSTDQLADLQRRIEDTLRAKGIDPSVLSDIGGSVMAPRKRVPNKNNGPRGDNKSNRNKAQAKPKPLSILQ